MHSKQKLDLITDTIKPLDLFYSQIGKSHFSWLDSSEQRNSWGEKSIFAVNPVEELLIKNYDQRPDSLENLLNKIENITADGKMIAIGYISYEAALPWMGIKTSRNSTIQSNDINNVLAHFLIYEHSLTYDHKIGKFNNQAMAEKLIGPYPLCSDEVHKLSTFKNKPSEIDILMTKAEYLKSLQKIKKYIHEGDIYQANLTCRFELKSSLSPIVAYDRLRNLNPSSYSAYLDFGNYQILSSSPERMFLKDALSIYSSPVKGTIERGDNDVDEARNLKSLLNSVKDRSELLMIVDLVRNDLGRVAKTGTVHVENLFRAEIYSSLIHLIADIKAELTADSTLSDIFKAILPGGSITGAPKRRAVEIINELESSSRNVYTGVIGYVQGGRADFNIAIRTITHSEGSYYLNSGGGIVADSDPIDEYHEMLLKAKNLIKAITNESYLT